MVSACDLVLLLLLLPLFLLIFLDSLHLLDLLHLSVLPLVDTWWGVRAWKGAACEVDVTVDAEHHIDASLTLSPIHIVIMCLNMHMVTHNAFGHMAPMRSVILLIQQLMYIVWSFFKETDNALS